MRCAACGGHLTHQGLACERAGGHHHRLTNPAGITFEVFLFDAAQGCAPRGPARAEHSWFPPTRWRFAHCRACGVQVGWLFVADGQPGAASFVGLMAERIRIDRN